MHARARRRFQERRMQYVFSCQRAKLPRSAPLPRSLSARSIVYGVGSPPQQSPPLPDETVPMMSKERASEICGACVHPQTHKVIFTPLRLSWILPSNVIVTAAMVAASKTGSYPLIALGQWLNQTYNVAHYYENRNATNESSDRELAMAYFGATTMSVAAAAAIER